ncbi:hypothetical protein L7F22_028170 [Adiantum nelumboides]|nr:hypothetical protein [Adiantum nelumboides]
MQSGNTLSTPMQPCLKLNKDDCPKSDAEKAKMAKVPYSLAVGSLMYAMVATKPDIAFAVGVVSCYHQIPVLHCDSQSAITLTKNPAFYSKMKHIEARYHVVRDILVTKRIELVKVHTDDNPGYALTKSIASERFTHCSEMMGIG